MKIFKDDKLIVGYAVEKPSQYSLGWKFLEIETGLKYFFDGSRWQVMNQDVNGLKEIEKSLYKYPDKHLTYKRSGKTLGAGNAMHVASHDESLWYVGSTHIQKTLDITGASTQGVAWDSAWGIAQDMVVFPDDSFVVFSNTETPLHTLIWKFADINDATPTKVYESEHDAQWSTSFGIKSSFNGLDGVILAGEYGNTQNSKDLLFNSDFGTTWKVIKSCGASQNTNNSHYHDVGIDLYNGLLWAVEGDAPENSDIVFSTTWGANWNRVKRNTDRGAGYQPTALFTFPERLVFGHDSNASGFSTIVNPKTLQEWDSLMVTTGLDLFKYQDNQEPALHMHHATKNRAIGGEPAYLQYSKQYGTMEGICFESGHGGLFPTRVFMTGDGGRSFHTVAVNRYVTTSEGIVANAIGISSLAMDAKFIYGDTANTGEIIYAEKPKWV